MGFVATFLKNFLFLLGGYSGYENNNNGTLPEVPPLIPRKVLYGNPDVTRARMDPGGKHLAFLKPRDGVLNIWVQSLEDALNNKSTARPVTNDKKRGIRSFSWTNLPDTLLFTQDKDGDENLRLYKLDAKTGKSTILTDTEGVRVRFIASDRKYPQTLYIGLNNRDPRYHDLYHLNLTTGEKDLRYLNVEGISSFIFDHKLNWRLATKEAADGGTDYFIPVTDAVTGNVTDFKFYRHVNFEDDLTTNPSTFNKDNDKLYWTDSEGRDLSALVLRDFENVDNVEVIYEPKKSDIAGVSFHPTEYTPEYVTENYRRPERTILDDAFRKDFKLLQAIDRAGRVVIVDVSQDNSQWMVVLTYDNQPARYYFYDRNLEKVAYLFTTRPNLEGVRLTKMHTVEVETRDGYTQVCYLSLPLENDPLGTGHPVKAGPLIMFVHGGPNARDSWGYSRSAQLWANRGYAVLQCNYRGSTGYGKEFINIAQGEWGRKMHFDLIDAANWAVEQGIALKDEIAIYGGSYGGYSALAGVTFTPKFFKCAVDIVGPSNLITLLNTIPPYWETARKSLIRRIGGDPDTEEGREFLRSRSPFFFADKIERPLLIAQGANDPRVKQAESDQIFEAMKAQKIPVTYIVFPDEGHGFARPPNNIAYVTKAEQFLAHCLGGRAEPKGSDSDGTTLQVIHEGGFQ